MTLRSLAILCNSEHFTHREACRVYELALRSPASQVVLDLSRVRDATTSAFARLVLLRRRLLQVGRDLRLRGLCDRAARLYEVSRLDAVLPSADAGHPAPVVQSC
jgi:anti-anti-sigma regulatory factor